MAMPSIGGGVASALLPPDINIMDCDTGEPLSFNLSATDKAVLCMPKINYFPTREERRHLTARGIDRLNKMGIDFGVQRKFTLDDEIIPGLKKMICLLCLKISITIRWVVLVIYQNILRIAGKYPACPIKV